MDPGQSGQNSSQKSSHPQPAALPPESHLDSTEMPPNPPPPITTLPDPPPPSGAVLESPFVSEPAYYDAGRDASPAERRDPDATPIASIPGVRFPPFQPPERHGTARPRDYRRAPTRDEAAHDQKLSEMGSVR
jgi:hypothetical protein